MTAIPNPQGDLSGGLDPEAPSSGTVYESASRSASPTQVVIGVPKGASEMALVYAVTADTAGNTVTPTIWGVDRTSGQLYTILVGSAKASGTITVLRVSPNIAASANAIAQDVLPSEICISIAHSNGSPITYSVGVHFAA